MALIKVETMCKTFEVMLPKFPSIARYEQHMNVWK